MKNFILIFLLLSSFEAFSQKWHLNNINRESKFKYEYWFQYQNLNDTSSFFLESSANKSISDFTIIDNSGNPVPFAVIQIQNSRQESTKIITANLEGKAFVKLEGGNYEIKISALNYDEFTYAFNLSNKEQLFLKVNLGLAPELEVYQINSKVKLTENEIKEVMQCVKENRSEFGKNCSKGKYKISMQI